MNMKKPFAYLQTIGLGAVNGFIFGIFTQIAYAIRFRLWLREIDRIAAETGASIDDFGYPWTWWMIAFFFMFVFAVVSPFMHWLRSKSALSRMRLWQEIGIISVIVSLPPVILYLYYWSSAYPVVEALFLLGMAFVINSIFGGFLQMVSNSHVRRKKSFRYRGAG